ncbi:MAG: YggT family protein [Propionibacteriaceae bacterium]|jgi:YggT family protein|nr:YggT family protein [Propionibacteriaceae bacterium]
MTIIGWTLLWVLTIYEWILIARAVFSWIQVINPRWTPKGVVLVIAETIYTVTDPPLKWLRKLIKPLRLGNIQLDMAFLVLFLVILVCVQVVQWVFF